jgi:isopenicillin N synthase-like dioxygenase
MTASTSNSSNSSTIPTIDFTPFMKEEGIVVDQAPTPAQLQVAQAIDAACRDHGFLYLTNFGLAKADRDEVFAAAAALFALDEGVKTTQLRPIHPIDNMGYAALYSESHNKSRPPESKEAFNVRFPPTNQNNLQGCPERFCAAEAKLRSIMTDTCRRYCLAIALALGLAPNFFHQFFAAMQLCTIRFLHYPPCDYQEPGHSSGDKNKLGSLRIGEHSDFGYVP